METSPEPIAVAPPTAMTGHFSAKGFGLALLVAPPLGLVWAWVADVAQTYAAPFILFPILLGIFVGLSVVGLARFAQVGHRPAIFLAAVLAASAATVGQHGVDYLATYRVASESVTTKTDNTAHVSGLLREMRPSFVAYLQAQARRGRPLAAGYVAQGWMVWLSWAVDAVLVMAAAVVVTVPAVRVPYCNRCGTWYRIIRSGKIDMPTAGRLAAMLGIEVTEPLRSPRYRVWACQGGCGPTRFELSWEESRATVDLVSLWLDASDRSRVAAILDGAAEVFNS